LGSFHRYGVDTRLGLPRRLSTGEVGRCVSDAFAGERLAMVAKIQGTGDRLLRPKELLPSSGRLVRRQDAPPLTLQQHLPQAGGTELLWQRMVSSCRWKEARDN
jgi:hypothetical protein